MTGATLAVPKGTFSAIDAIARNWFPIAKSASALHLNHDLLRLGLLLHLRPQDLLQVDKAPRSGSIWHGSPHARLCMQFSL